MFPHFYDFRNGWNNTLSPTNGREIIVFISTLVCTWVSIWSELNRLQCTQWQRDICWVGKSVMSCLLGCITHSSPDFRGEIVDVLPRRVRFHVNFATKKWWENQEISCFEEICKKVRQEAKPRCEFGSNISKRPGSGSATLISYNNGKRWTFWSNTITRTNS
jgi:hypothetical protein